MMSTTELIQVKTHFHTRHDWKGIDDFEHANSVNKRNPVSIEFDPIDAAMSLLMDIVYDVVTENDRKHPCATWLITVIFKDSNDVFGTAKEVHVYVLDTLQVVINIYQT